MATVTKFQDFSEQLVRVIHDWADRLSLTYV